MLSSVLKSDVAIAANIAIMRAFVQVREYLMAASSISTELKELRAKVDLLTLQREEDLGALNDLSEDVRQDIDNLYIAIGELSSRLEEKKNNEPRLVFSRTAKNSYSFFNSMAGLVRAALRVCQRTVPKAMAREMRTATTNTQP